MYIVSPLSDDFVIGNGHLRLNHKWLCFFLNVYFGFTVHYVLPAVMHLII